VQAASLEAERHSSGANLECCVSFVFVLAQTGVGCVARWIFSTGFDANQRTKTCYMFVHAMPVDGLIHPRISYMLAVCPLGPLAAAGDQNLQDSNTGTYHDVAKY
jgi:hypothetical protein